MPATKTRKPPWTLDQWSDYSGRCRRMRDRLYCLAADVSRLPGVRCPTIDAFLKTARLVEEAMVKMENVFESQHPEARGRVISLIHGGGWAKGRTEESISRHIPGRLDRNVVIAKWAWILEGRRVKTLSRDGCDL